MKLELDNLENMSGVELKKVARFLIDLATHNIDYIFETSKIDESSSKKTALETLEIATGIASEIADDPQKIIDSDIPQSPLNNIEKPGAEVEFSEPYDLVLMDIRNVLWDEKIHSRTRSLNANGSWRKKRNMSDEEVARLETHAAPSLPDVSVSTIEPGEYDFKGSKITIEKPSSEILDVVVESASIAEVPVKIEIAPPPPAAATGTSFQDFMRLITKLIAANKISRREISELLKAHGVEDLTLVSTRLDLIPVLTTALSGYF